MPEMNQYICKNCGFELPGGWGGHMYVEDDDGKRIVCPHPAEEFIIRKVLGDDAPEELIKKRVGFNSDCICLDCLHQFQADIALRPYFVFVHRDQKQPKDRRVCPKCNSSLIQTTLESIGKICPRCKEGQIEEILGPVA